MQWFESIPIEEEKIEMCFFILVENPDTWSQIDNAFLIQLHNGVDSLLTQSTDSMDVVFICSEPSQICSQQLFQLREKFRLVFFFPPSHDLMPHFQQVIKDLCWMAYHGGNFDILDVESLLGSAAPIIVANQTMLQSGWHIAHPVRRSIMLLHSNEPTSPALIDKYEQEIKELTQVSHVSLVAFSHKAYQSESNYSVLFAVEKEKPVE